MPGRGRHHRRRRREFHSLAEFRRWEAEQVSLKRSLRHLPSSRRTSFSVLVSFRLPPEQFEALFSSASRARLSVSEFCRRLVSRVR